MIKPVMICSLIIAGLAPDAAHAQQTWRTVPKIAVIGPAGDPRLPAADEAVAFWNRTFTELGSGFRLGAVSRMVRPIPQEALPHLPPPVLPRPAFAPHFPPPLP